MTFFTQLTPPIPVFARGQPGLAHGVIDYGPEHDLYWVVFCKDGEVWTLKNKEVRGQENVTEERTKIKPTDYLYREGLLLDKTKLPCRACGGTYAKHNPGCKEIS